MRRAVLVWVQSSKYGGAGRRAQRVDRVGILGHNIFARQSIEVWCDVELLDEIAESRLGAVAEGLSGVVVGEEDEDIWFCSLLRLLFFFLW